MITSSERETKDFAKDLVNKLTAPTILALEGDLGAGKTTFTQGIAENLNIKKRVLSPTFVFLRSYDLENQVFDQLHHVDLYRCTNLEDARSVGLEEILADQGALIIIEWPEIAKRLLPKNTVWLKFTKIDGTRREIAII